MNRHRNTLALIVIAALAVTSVTPSLARPNNGAYSRSSEALKKEQTAAACGDIKQIVQDNEKLADKHAGTKAAAKYSKEADEWYNTAHALGCSWAQ